MNIFRNADLAPALDPREQTLDPRTIPADAIAVDIVLVNHQTFGTIPAPVFARVAVIAGMTCHPRPVFIVPEERHQVLRAREDEQIGFFEVENSVISTDLSCLVAGRCGLDFLARTPLRRLR